MAKFFRKIRQQLLSEHRVKKYLIYAIGEIILVVIGILVALQVNSVNQDRQRAKLEKVLLDQIRFELLEIYEDIWRDAGVLTMGDNGHYSIHQFISQDKPYVDSLCFDFYWMSMDEYIYPTNAAYSRFKEEGLDIIQNDSIRIDIQSLYEGHFPRLMRNNSFTPNISDVFQDYYLHAFKPNTDLALSFYCPLASDTVGSRIYTDAYYVFPKMDNQRGNQYTIGYVPLDFNALKQDPKFLMLMEQAKRYRDYKLRHYSYVKSIIKKVIQLIERELE